MHTREIYNYYGCPKSILLISNKGPYNFHSMTFYGFSKNFSSVKVVELRVMRISISMRCLL
jgi:hypothetical protein